jgi:hypothetical protein
VKQPVSVKRKKKLNALVDLSVSHGIVSLVIYPDNRKLALKLGRFYLMGEAVKDKNEEFSMGAFAHCMEDEFDAPVGFIDFGFQPDTEKGKKLMKRIEDSITPIRKKERKP